VAGDYEREQSVAAMKARGMTEAEIADLEYAKQARVREQQSEAQRAQQEAQAKTQAEQKAAQEAEHAYRSRVIETAKSAIDLLGVDAQGVHRNLAAEFLFPQTAQILKAAEEAGIELTPERVAAELDSKMNEITDHTLASLDGPPLLKRLGQPLLEKIVKAIRAGGSAPAATPAVGSPATSPEREEPRRRTAEEDRDRRAASAMPSSEPASPGGFRWGGR
jgi:hypothetical protein